MGVLRDFEADGLKTHDQLNNVYRKSLISAYASAVGVDADLAQRTVSSSVDGVYDGTLARTYLSWSPQTVEDSPGGREADRVTKPASRRKTRLASRNSLAALSSSRQAQLGSKIVGLIFVVVAVVVALVLATGSP